MISWRFYEPSDYPLVCEWWNAWKHWQPLPASALPPRGIIVSVDDIPTMAAWLYLTDSTFALIEWFISNPTAKKQRGEALALLIEQLVLLAARHGARHVASTVRNQHLIRALKAQGFGGEEATMTNLVRNIEWQAV